MSLNNEIINEKRFNVVFSKIAFSENIKKIFNNAIVKSIQVYKLEKVLEIKIFMDNIVDEVYIELLKDELIKELPYIKNVITIFSFNDISSLSLNEKLEKYWNNIIYMVYKESKLCGEIIKNSSWNIEESKLYIKVKNNTSYYMSKRNINKKIEHKLKNEFDINLKVFFKDEKLTIEQKECFNNEMKEKEFHILNLIKQNEKEKECNEKKEEINVFTNNIKNGIIIGKYIKEESTKIINANIEGENLVIEGNIFNIDKRELKSGDKYIVSFDINDFSDSITVKFFVSKNIFDTELKKYFDTNKYLKIKGEIKYDKYAEEINIMARDICIAKRPLERMDNSEEKRVELHLHTQMSSMDGIASIKSYIQRAAKWGHKAIAITDHGVVQAFPDAMDISKKLGVKVIYGIEAYLINDLGNVVICPKGQTVYSKFVVFDIETTGLSREEDRITEIGAIKIENRKIVERFSTFVNPEIEISNEITKLTGITNDMVKNAPTISEVLPKFIEFFSDSVLVAHNASFDVGFIRYNIDYLKMPSLDNTVLDTLELSKTLLPDLKKYKLNIVAEEMNVSLDGHHRALNDAQATADIFIKFIDMLIEKEIYTLENINVFSSHTINYKKLKHYHAVILVKNYVGLRNLYELVSISHLDYFFKRPRIPKSKFIQMREGLIIGSACEAGELYRALIDYKPIEYINEIVNFYDYLEIQPLKNNEFMINSNKISSVKSFDDIINFNKKIIELGEKNNKLVVATGDVHFIDKEDATFRKIIMAAEKFSDADKQPPLYYRTTEEMLKEFEYIEDSEKIKEIVIKNTNIIADMIEDIKPVPDGTFTPKIEGADEELRNITNTKAISIYGSPLPIQVKERLDKELNSIISNGYAVLYIIAQKLVWKSLEDGYLVGSRGSVGSSFVATMAGITEVNPLQAHYVCPVCKYSDFTSDIVKLTVSEEGTGYDMPDKNCPNCNSILNKEGHDIPFETFLGFEGDKEPDIDLNFSGEYQQKAHSYTEELFGKGYIFKAGTIGTLAEKTAYGFVKKYLDEREIVVRNAEINRLVLGCTGIKRTTGQHPGGLMVVPSNHNIYEFCPVQRPANDMNSNVITTHFDYHSISGRLLKLDLLGHDDPTVIRMLYDITGINPQSVSFDDKDTMSLFKSPDILNVTSEEINCETGTLGIPEFGTKFVRQMLIDTKPETFSDLVRISGLSHGTDVWINNAQTLIEDNIITLKETISTRDSIMIYLINKGINKKKAFKIMESVRKGKGLSIDDIEEMKKFDVPNWYIESCQKIKYMFPKAHAAAYVMMAFRIAYFKVNYPMAYYASYFTVRASDDFDYLSMCRGIEVAKSSIKKINDKEQDITTKDKNKLIVLEIVVEFYARGFEFLPIDLYKSDATKFLIDDKDNKKLIPPFNSLQGLGITAAQGIVNGRKNIKEFTTIEDFKEKTSVGKSLIELLKENNILKDLPETNQLTLFDF